jgi:hypothetical protein
VLDEAASLAASNRKRTGSCTSALALIRGLILARKDEIRDAWDSHFLT